MFDAFTRRVSYYAGRPWAFLSAIALIGAWTVSGPFFGWSERHSLLINTLTTIVTFLMLFIVQNTQTRDTAELKALLKEVSEDLPEVDDAKARKRVGAEERP